MTELPHECPYFFVIHQLHLLVELEAHLPIFIVINICLFRWLGISCQEVLEVGKYEILVNLRHNQIRHFFHLPRHARIFTLINLFFLCKCQTGLSYLPIAGLEWWWLLVWKIRSLLLLLRCIVHCTFLWSALRLAGGWSDSTSWFLT